MKTQKNEFGNKILIGLWFGLAGLLLLVCYLSESDFNFEWPWKKKATPVITIVAVEETKITLDGFVKEFVKQNHSRISEGDFLSSEIPAEKILGEVSSKRVTMSKISEEGIYYPGKVYPWVIKYRIPSVVRKVPGGTQLSVEYPFFLLEDTSVCYIEKKGNFPYIVVETNGKFWLFDQNLDELPRW
jgi:hypothetical protein